MYDTPEAIATCLNCPVTAGCVHDLGQGYHYLCPLEETAPLAQTVISPTPSRKHFRVAYRQRLLEKIETILQTEEAPHLTALARRLPASPNTLIRWIKQGVLVDRRVRRRDTLGRIVPVRLIIGVNEGEAI